jgi:hypothetical protein
MKETKKKVKKAPKQIMRGAKAPALSIDALKSKAFKSHQQKQEQNVVVNINQPAKPKHKKTASNSKER